MVQQSGHFFLFVAGRLNAVIYRANPWKMENLAGWAKQQQLMTVVLQGGMHGRVCVRAPRARAASCEGF